MPVIPRPQLPQPVPEPRPDVINPERYRFGGYVFEMDSDENIICRVRVTAQPAYWSLRAVRYFKADLR